MTFNHSTPYDDSKLRDILAVIAFQLLENTATGGIEKFVDFFADEFEDETGIDAAGCDGQPYDAVNDRYNVTPSTAVQCTGGSALSGGDHAGYNKNDVFDANTGTQWMCSQEYGAISGAAYIGYCFATAKMITLMNVYQAGSDYKIASAKVQYSDDGSSWSDLQTVSLPTAPWWNNLTLTNTTQSHRYWRLLANAEPPGGAGYHMDIYEIYMGITTTSYTLVSNAVTAESNDPATVRVILLVDLNSLTITVNTDLKAWVSIDNGSHYEAVTLAYKGLDGTGRAIYSGEVNPTARTDKRIKVKAQVLNSKNIFVKAWGALWKY